MPRQPKRFLVKDLELPGLVVLDSNDSYHLRGVLRLKSGDTCLVADSKGREALALVSQFRRDGLVELKLMSSPKNLMKNSYIIVAQAIPQRGIMNALVQKAGELGIAKLIPLITKRTQVHIAGSALERVMGRWKRIAREAAKQSGNPEISVELPSTVEEILQKRGEFKQIYLAHPKAEPLNYKSVTESNVTPAKAGIQELDPRFRGGDMGSDDQPVLILIGPEGGFTEEEIDQAEKAGATVFSLFSGVLKSETAFVSIVSLFRYLLESGKAN